ncbi:MAG: 50S ribosomal protein L9 [Flavobacteriaceae bacterium]|jgi:large subunit ribosomal protein L9|nr:50S ribosomal protein L9 [Flavobacteriaceae bacterium]MBL6692727.1 50S ribosomal protein L9 [Flavobacteriaceae bacterium]MCH1609551.1 50S ribosomal protein L9 [Flavobacteriaceae bacterium]MDG1968899.1 50S ribosomal protein L9 [Flavobacteriaceae bacterium]CAI8230312.1 MAG: 50S ribosomal protein L9 [Flavobacteriaceae bacterium]
MQIILKENVENLGFKDDLVKVKNGYGRNFLIPQGKAVLATTSAKKVLAENLKQKAFKEKKIIDDANALGEKLMAINIKISSKVGSGDKLFGSVTAADLVKAFEGNGHEIDKNAIAIPGKTIKRLGSYEAKIRLHREVAIQFPFEVIPEKK